MKGSLLALLLSSTAITAPSMARAGPVVAFVGGIINAVAGVGAIGLTAGTVGAFGAGFTVGSFLTSTIVGRVVLGIGINALASSFAPSPNFNAPPPSEIMANFAEPISYAETAYGITRKGGPLGFTGAKDDKRFYVPILASHEIDGIEEHWLDEWTVGVDDTVTGFDSANLLTASDSGAFTAPDPVKTRGRIEPFFGRDGQLANAGLISKFSELTPAHDFAGLSGAVVWAAKVPPDSFTEVYPNSRQWGYTPVIRGHNKIYDPRDHTRKFTRNAGLILAHWLTEVLGRSVDWADVAIEADAADVQVPGADGVMRPRWTINGRIRDDESFEAQRTQLAGACDAFLFERPDGKVGFRLGRWIGPDVTLSAGDFLSLEITEGQWGANAPTEVSVVYTEPDNAWRESPSGVWVERDDLRSVRDEPKLFLITNHDQAVTVAKRIAKSRRAQYQLRGTIGFMGYELIGKRFFSLRNSALHVEADFEIAELRRINASTFEITANSARAEDFDVPSAEETPTRPRTSRVESNFTTPEIANIAAAAAAGGRAEVTWNLPPDYLWQQVRWRPTSGGDYRSLTTTESTSSAEITGLLDGEVYEVQVRNVSAPLLNRPSAWLPEVPLLVTAIQNPTPPAALTALTATADGADVTVSFTAPNDPNYFASRIWRGVTATFAAADLVRTEFGIPSSGDVWTDPGLDPDEYFYWAAPINPSGVEGDLSGPVSVTVT